MTDPRATLWTFDRVEPDQRGPDTSVTLGADQIARYDQLAHAPRAHQGVAMPSMILSYAPLQRESIARANGFVALEEAAPAARRQTPFTKCTIVWLRLARVGDTIRASRAVHAAYTRRGSHFVTFRVSASNQRDELIGHYDYTCVFDLAPREPARPASAAAPPPALPGRTLAGLTVTETEHSLRERDAFRLAGTADNSIAGRPAHGNIHTDAEFARRSIFGSMVNSGPATMSYVNAMLELSYPRGTRLLSGTLQLRALSPWRAGDTVNLEGSADGADACTLRGLNQAGTLVFVATAAPG